jgi:hypothetical protein
MCHYVANVENKVILHPNAKRFFPLYVQQRPYPMGETPIVEVPNPRDNITSNKEVRLVEAIMPN